MKKTIPWSYSTHSIDINLSQQTNKKNIKIDIDKTEIPETFDFGYARHIFEDIQNPDFVFSQFVKSCPSGYIETPPMIECMKDIKS